MRFTLAPLAALAAVLFVSGCATPPRAPRPAPEPVALPRPAPPVLPVQGPDWRDWAVTPGDWTYRGLRHGSVAVFGNARGDALLTLSCDPIAGMVRLGRSAAAATPLTLRTSSLVRTLAVQPTGPLPGVTAALTPRDPLLDALAFSRGRFIVEQQGSPTLVVPAWAEVGRVIEDCRG